MNAFRDVPIPVDEDTYINSRYEARIGQFIPVLIESWTWGAVTGFSVIFKVESLCGMSDDEIKMVVSGSPLPNDRDIASMTVSRPQVSPVVFVNYDIKLS